MNLRLQGTITAIDNGTATIQIDDQVLKVPVRDFTPRPEVGDPYILMLLPESEAKLSTDELARAVLTQLIHDVPVPADSQKVEEN